MDFEPRPRVLSFQSVQSSTDEEYGGYSGGRRASEAGSTTSSRRLSLNPQARKASKIAAYISPYRHWRNLNESAREKSEKAGQDEEKKPEVENTYRIEPKRKFPEREVKEIIQNSLEAMLGELTYNATECGFLTKLLSSRIMEQVKSLSIERYKLVCLVNVGSKHDQGLRVVSRCLWNADFDTHVSANIENGTLFAVATVYGVYFE